MFESGQIIGYLKHYIKQVFYNVIFRIHILKRGHKLAMKYETYGELEN